MNKKYWLCVSACLYLSCFLGITQDVPDNSIKFYDGQKFTIIGKFHDEKVYARFPARYESLLRPEVWKIGQRSAGMSILFYTNATDIVARWTVTSETNSPNMATTGIRGVDLYANVDGA